MHKRLVLLWANIAAEAGGGAMDNELASQPMSFLPTAYVHRYRSFVILWLSALGAWVSRCLGFGFIGVWYVFAVPKTSIRHAPRRPLTARP